ncbi:ATP-binding cassette domain-containing protein [Tessaracoccus coleopterorum]|uniref:ATP-binding cassette domain-containing protein n=1 Tax=Tessaracoccus coleopterorum TaxID=2714950 RepID=UPI001E5D888C|nr:ATP-binding cassette domain-containing protein [Tessaracoccus coleopterorum]
MGELARDYLGRLRTRIPDLKQPLIGLSGGQRQCVAIARTLVDNPRIVVLDEPTASLSVSQTAEVLSYIEDLRDRGLGIIMISHNLTDVRAVADRVEVLRHGRNNGSFPTETATYEEIIAAITGATHT